MELNTAHRIWLTSILPESGTLTDYRILRDLKNELGFSEEEIKERQFKNENGTVRWEPGADKPKDIAIGDRGKELVVEALKKLAKTPNVNPQNAGLFDMFGVTDEEPQEV